MTAEERAQFEALATLQQEVKGLRALFDKHDSDERAFWRTTGIQLEALVEAFERLGDDIANGVEHR
jgi:siderophore synthetase component